MVEFIIPGLNTNVNLSTNIEYPDIPSEDGVVASYTLTINVPENKLMNIFYFKTTNPDLTSSLDTSDCAFYCDNSYWPDISFSEGLVNNSINTDILDYSYDVLKKLGPCWMAKNITGGYNNSDIFVNESKLVENYVALDISGQTSVKNKIRGNLLNGGTLDAPLSNNDTGINNLSRQILNYFYHLTARV